MSKSTELNHRWLNNQNREWPTRRSVWIVFLNLESTIKLQIFLKIRFLCFYLERELGVTAVYCWLYVRKVQWCVNNGLLFKVQNGILILFGISKLHYSVIHTVYCVFRRRTTPDSVCNTQNINFSDDGLNYIERCGDKTREISCFIVCFRFLYSIFVIQKFSSSV